MKHRDIASVAHGIKEVFGGVMHYTYLFFLYIERERDRDIHIKKYPFDVT